MQSSNVRQLTAAHRFPAILDGLLSRFSYGLIPLAIVIFTLAAFLGGEDTPHTGGTTLSFQVAEEAPHGNWTPEAALEHVRPMPATQFQDTQLSEQPQWLLVHLPERETTARTIELASRHAQDVSCWDAHSLQLLGHASRHGATGHLQTFRAGFAVRSSPELAIGNQLLCRTTYSGPARITVVEWPESEVHGVQGRFRWGAGLLEGAFITLALFILFAAAVNREGRYVLLAVWLVGNLRLAAISMGWDTEWLGWRIPPDWMPKVRTLTIAAYYIVTYALFTLVFKEELQRLGSVFVRVGQSLGFVLLGVAIVTPFSVFLPIMWVLVTIGSLGIITFLTRCVILIGSRNAMWFGAALALVLLATFSEVIAAAFGFKNLIGSFNSVTAALIASLMAAMAFAHQIRTERRERMRAQEDLQHTYNLTPVGLFTLDESGSFIRTNNAMRQLLAVPTDQAEPDTWAQYFGEASWQQLRKIAASSGNAETEIRTNLHNDTEASWFLARVTRFDNLIEGSLQDITERQKLTNRFRFLANNDPLTGVLNRRGIERRLEKTLESLHAQPGRNMAVAYLDLDRFKLINDLYGHQMGDEILKQVCARLIAALPGQHAVGRIGGDEFVLLMNDIPIEDATALCYELIDRISNVAYRVRSQAFQVKVSIGLIEADTDLDIKDIISAADRACREAKSRLHGALVVYKKHASAFRERVEELQLIQALGGSFSPEGLFLMMQPIISLQKPTSGLDFEVLVRMRGNDGSVIPASRVIAAAEANGNISSLDLWILTTTLEWIRSHLHHLQHTRFICVNLSGSSLNDEAFLEEVIRVLDRYQDVAQYLCFEITEGVALQDIDNSRRFIERLRRFGSRIALDDFGAGYTSFLYLKDLAADALKIDGSFIRSLNEHPSNVSILEAIVQLARNLGMRTVAEWVEDFDTLEVLLELGVDYAQGYLVAAPMPPETLLLQKSAAGFVTDDRLLQYINETPLLHEGDELFADRPPQWYH